MTNRISKREFQMLERDRRENCGYEGYRYTQRRHVSDRVVSDRQRRKVEREKRNKKLKETVQIQIHQASSETRMSTRQRPYTTVKPATNAANSPATSIPVLLKQPGQSTSTTANAIETAPTCTHDKATNDIKVVSMGDIRVKTRSDVTYCYISGSVLLPGNKLILADFRNSKVKLVNLQTSKVTAELTTSSGPLNITSMSGGIVVVTVPECRKILFVKVTDKLRLDRELPVDRKCWAVLHTNDKLIVSYEEPREIEIMSLDGKTRRKIADSKVIRSPYYMTLSRDNKAIYVSDFGRDCVKRLSLDGAVEASYEDEKLKWPMGIVRIGGQDRLLVCGSFSNNIYTLEPDLTKGKLLIQDIAEPKSLSYCHSTGILYVGVYGSDSIKVYKLS